jgi:hypothetical protein
MSFTNDSIKNKNYKLLIPLQLTFFTINNNLTVHKMYYKEYRFIFQSILFSFKKSANLNLIL